MTLAGQERLMCFSTRARYALEDRFGGLKEMAEAFSAENVRAKSDAILDAAVILLDAGARHAKMSGLETAGALTKEELLDLTSTEELEILLVGIYDAITAGAWRTVGAEPPKNGDATPDKPAM